NFAARMANMTPEERQQFLERMRARGLDSETMGRRGDGQGADPPAGQTPSRPARPARTAPAAADERSAKPTATTIDALFGPLPATETFGQAWLFQNAQLSRVPLRLGITD